MDNKLDRLFSERDFDLKEPHKGHLERFERRLKNKKSSSKSSWKWMSVAASVVLMLGFWLGSNHQKTPTVLADIAPEMQEVETYFVSAIYQEVKTLEKNRTLQTETIVETALDKLEELEDGYQNLLKELIKNGQQKKIIGAMIENYQKRLEILQNVLQKIEQIKNPNILNDEIYI